MLRHLRRKRLQTRTKFSPLSRCGCRAGLAETVVRAAQVTGVDPAYMTALADKESSLLPDNKARTSPQGGSAPASAGEGPTPARATAPDQALDLDTAAIDRALGRKGKVNGGVYQVSVPRAEMPREAGMEVPAAMGSAIAINFQPTGGGKAAITGDFVLTADEVNPVLRTLRANGIEVTALHNHMLDDEPRLFFMHFWANDDAQKLANALAAALEKVRVAKS